jgi:hypothetical protein
MPGQWIHPPLRLWLSGILPATLNPRLVKSLWTPLINLPDADLIVAVYRSLL